MAERALADGRQADARRGAGENRPLLGVPIAVKDTEDVAGEPTAWGAAVQAGPAERDTGVWNMTGQPALSIPAPPASDGLPIGAQLIAPPEGEGRLLALAAQLERELDWPAHRPPVS